MLILSPKPGTLTSLSVYSADAIHSAHFVRWIAEANRAVKVVEDRELKELMGAGRPEFKMPSRRTVARDLNTAYGRCSRRIRDLLSGCFL